MLGARIVGEAMNGGIIELLTIEDIFMERTFMVSLVQLPKRDLPLRGRLCKTGNKYRWRF